MKKRRQHHVWKVYLRAWATKDRLSVLQNNQVRPAHIDDVAVERDFYKLQALTPLEIAYIRKYWIEPSPPASHQVHENSLFMFSAWANLRKKLTGAQAEKNPELTAFLDEQVINAEEDFHCGLETRATPLIKLALNGDMNFYQEQSNAILISHFLALQHFRTAAMRKRVTEGLKVSPDIDLSRCWNVMAHIFAVNVGFSLFADRKRNPLTLIENRTATPFVTSDQPTVNLLSDGGERAPDHLALYYPISPSLAFLIDDADNPCRIAEAPISEDVVVRLNNAEVKASDRQVFANHPDLLSSYIGLAT